MDLTKILCRQHGEPPLKRSERELHKFTQINTAAPKSSGNTKEKATGLVACSYSALSSRREVWGGRVRPLGTAEVEQRGPGGYFRAESTASPDSGFKLSQQLFLLCL